MKTPVDIIYFDQILMYTIQSTGALVKVIVVEVHSIFKFWSPKTPGDKDLYPVVSDPRPTHNNSQKTILSIPTEPWYTIVVLNEPLFIDIILDFNTLLFSHLILLSW